MYTIAKGVVAQQNFDVTKDCKIIEAYTDNKGVKTGVYKVKSQDAIFDAYAQQNTEYFVNQMVYVSILNGDYDNDKFIIGQKIDKDNESSIYNLRMPFDDFFGLYNLTQYNPMVAPRAYWANCPSHGDDQTDVSDVAFPKSDDHVWHWENKEGAKIYATKLGLEVDVTTLLHGYNLISGHYGLRIVVNGEIKGNNNEPNSYGYKTYSFSDENMYGNPYAYTSPSTQQIVVDISDFLRVDSIDVWFTQDHDFKDELGNAIPYGATDFTALLQDYQAAIAEIAGRTDLTVAEKELAANNALQEFSTSLNNSSDLYNISFENLHCFLGMSAEELKEEEVILYTYEAMSYGIDSEDERIRDLDRQLNLAWVHATQKGVIMVDSYEQLKELEATLYWYKYDKSWELGHEDYDIENLSHRLGGNYWRPIDVVHPETGAITLTVTPDRDMNKQRYKAIIRFQGSSLVSNVLVFTNTATPETDRENLARNDKIILRCAVLKEDEDGNITLLPDDAIGNFFVYNENNHILANDDNVLFSNVKYFIEPWIRPYSGDVDETDPKYGYQRLADYVDEDGNHYNFNVTWQFPESFTMIRTWGLLDDSARDENYWNNRTDILFERDKKATRYFYIDSTHNIRYNDNEISAIIEIEGMGEFTAKKELLFGRAGAFGCEFTPVITISEPAGNYYVDTSTSFELHCLVYDRQGRLLPAADRAACKFSWKYYGTANKPNNQVDCQNYEGFIGNVIRGRITKPEPFVVEVTVSGAAEYDITVRRGIMVSDDAEFMHDHDIICPDRVEFRSDGQTPFYAANPFEVQRVVTGSGTTVDGQTYSYQNELIYPEWKINNTKVLHLIPRTAEYPTFTLPNGNYVTRAQATQYGLQFSADVLNTNIAEPVAIGQQWTEDLLGEDYFTYIYFTYDGVTVAQAIAFAQNLYPSSLVNEWDGQSLALDEENGAIIAKMIAAGTKQRNRFTGVMMGDWREKGDESLETPGLYGFNAGQQAFGLKTDGTGFIGPSGEGRIQFDGRNALISNSSKTCYINLNPRRVADYLSPDGSGYKINNQAWDAINNQSISQYFLYTQTPRRISTFATNDNENNSGTIQPAWATDWTQHQEKRWVDKFLDDSNHDYFIVDPSYGVMTTGGIFARYGQLGHKYPWVISDYGLTQKNIFGRIFLGNPEKNLSIGTNIPTPTFTTSDGEIEAPTNFYSASFSNANNVIQTGIRADGYLYTRFATIGGWYINDNEMYAVDTSLLEDGDISQGFRKTQKTTNDSGYIDDGYKLDLLNINSKNQFIAFNNGRFVINGKHGWMGFYSHKNDDNSYDTIELTEKPSAYNMWIDFHTGDIGFGKPEPTKYDDDGNLISTIPYSYISGNNGSAYFSKGQVQINGEDAIIYCGVSTDFNGVFPSVDNVKVGTLYLAGIQYQGITQEENTKTDYTLPSLLKSVSQSVNTKDTQSTEFGDYSKPNIILPFDLGDYSDIVEGGSETTVEKDGKYVYLSSFTGSYTLTTTDQEANPVTIGGKGYASQLLRTADDSDSDNGIGIEYFYGNNSVAIRSKAGSGYLIDWNLIGDYITVNSTLDANTIKGTLIYMPDDSYNTGTASYALVATQPWVSKIIEKDLWPKVVTVNNLAAAAMEKAKRALNKAISAANNAAANAGKIQEILDTAVMGAALKWIDAGEYGTIGLTITKTTGEVTEYQWSEAMVIAAGGGSGGHYHKIYGSTDNERYLKLNISRGYSGGSYVEATIGSGISLKPALKGIVYDLVADSSAGTLSWSVIGGTAGNFNIADTEYFKEAVAAAQEEGYAAAIARCSIDTSTNKVSIAAGTFAEQSTTTKTASASATAKAYDGDTSYSPYRRYDPTNVPAKGSYTNDAGSKTGSFTYTGYYYKTEALTLKATASISWS